MRLFQENPELSQEHATLPIGRSLSGFGSTIAADGASVNGTDITAVGSDCSCRLSWECIRLACHVHASHVFVFTDIYNSSLVEGRPCRLEARAGPGARRTEQDEGGVEPAQVEVGHGLRRTGRQLRQRPSLAGLRRSPAQTAETADCKVWNGNSCEETEIWGFGAGVFTKKATSNLHAS